MTVTPHTPSADNKLRQLMCADLYLQHPSPVQNLQCVHIESPANPDSYQMSELLGWFAQASKVQQLPDFPDGDSRSASASPAVRVAAVAR